MANPFKIGRYTISNGEIPFIVAETGLNHNGSLDTAIKMIEVAKECGVDAVKFQTYKTSEFIANKSQSYTYQSHGREITESTHDLFARCELPKDAWKKIKKKCDELEIVFFSSPQNYSDLQVLLEVGVPAVKVGSDDLTNLPMLRNYTSAGLPLLLSCGMADMADVHKALEAVGWFNRYPTAVLLCTSEYPTQPIDVNIQKLETLKSAFPGLVIGFSDHTEGFIAASLAVAYGACIFEKHFTLDHTLYGPDHWFSADPKELREWTSAIRTAHAMIGSPIIMPTDAERTMRSIARRSITAIKDIVQGETFDDSSIGMRRPGNGLPPEMLSSILGRTATKNIAAGTTLSLGDFI